MKVLLVDDHAATLRLQVALMQQAGWEAQGVASGAEALQVVRDWQPDAILLDLSLPDHDGLEILIRLRLEHLCHVVILSGLERHRLWPVVKELGASDYIEKGTDPGDIVAKLEATMSLQVPPRRYIEDLRRRTLELV